MMTKEEIDELGLDPVDSFALFFGQMFGWFDEDENNNEGTNEDGESKTD